MSIVNSLHNSQELIRDQQGRNSLLATYLYWVFRLPDPPQDMHNAGTDSFFVYLFFLLFSSVSDFSFNCICCDYFIKNLSFFVRPLTCVQVQGVRSLRQRAVTVLWVGPRQPQLAVCFSSPECVVAATLTFPVHTPLLKMRRSKISSLARYGGSA